MIAAVRRPRPRATSLTAVSFADSISAVTVGPPAESAMLLLEWSVEF